MLERIRNSFQFSLASLVTGIMALVALLSILTRERFRSSAGPFKNRAGAFLAEKRRTIAFYRVFSHAYDLVNVNFYTDAMRKGAVDQADIHQSSLVLDVGCGTGYTTEAILDRLRTGRVVGLDLTPQQLRKATKNLREDKAKLTLLRGDAENLPFRGGSFDACLSVGALEYFPDPKRVLEEMTRIVRNGSKLVVGGPELDWFKKVSVNRVLYTPSTNEVEGFFKQAGLGDIKSVLTGVNTFFGTNRYVVIVAGVK